MKRAFKILQQTFSVLLPALLLLGCNGKNKPIEPASTKTDPANSAPTNLSSVATPAPSDENAKVATAAGVSGKITLKGTPPPEKPLPMDSVCGQLHTAAATTRFYVVGDGGELADVFVAIKSGLEGKTFATPEQPVLLDQVGCEYTPYVVGLQTGQKLLVKNSDPMMHNIHAVPKVAGNKESNKAQMPKGKDYEFTFSNPEVFLTFKCDVHPWMFAYVGVVEHPFFAVSGKNGMFQFKNVPDGKYVIEATHRKAGKQTKEVTVADGKSSPIEFSFEVPVSP